MLYPISVVIIVAITTLIVYVKYKLKTMRSIDRISWEAKLSLRPFFGKIYLMTGQSDRLRPNDYFKLTGRGGVVCPLHCAAHGVTSNEFYNFNVRNSDVIVSTFPKSGTTWMQEITWLICHNADTIKSKEAPLDYRAPFYEYIDPLYNYPRAIKALESWPEDEPRIIKTHVPFEFLPKQFQIDRKCKMIYVARNAKDACVSLYHFHKINPELPHPVSWEQFLAKFCSGEVVYGSWFDHVLKHWKKFQEQGDKKYIYFTTYETLKQNLRGEIANVCKFLEKDLTEKQMDGIADHCTMEKMKNNKSTNHSYRDDMGSSFKKGMFMRKGEVGDWKNYFTLNQNSAFDELYEEKMKESSFHTPFEL